MSNRYAALAHKGDTWNESMRTSDPVTVRPVRRLTVAGYNEKPTYHANIALEIN